MSASSGLRGTTVSYLPTYDTHHYPIQEVGGRCWGQGVPWGGVIDGIEGAYFVMCSYTASETWIPDSHAPWILGNHAHFYLIKEACEESHYSLHYLECDSPCDKISMLSQSVLRPHHIMAGDT